jgi:hypothetical protein
MRHNLKYPSKPGGALMADGNVVPFGKYKGQPVEALIADADYLNWLKEQAWFRERYATIYQLVINYGAEPTETPDHNALQVLFLDDGFCLGLARHLAPNIDAVARKCWNDDIVRYATGPLADERYKLWSSPRSDEAKVAEINAKIIAADPRRDAQIDFRFVCEFERGRVLKNRDGGIAGRSAHPVDVLLRVWFAVGDQQFPRGYYKDEYEWREFLIELKPTVSDDYPSVLRQMRANGATILLLREYTGRGATREQFIKTFATADIRVVFVDEVKS